MTDETAGTEHPLEQPAPDAAAPSAGAQETPRRGRRLAVAGGVGVVAALAAGGVLAWSQLSGGGTQPHDVLPADAIGYLRLDLDPDAGQKVDLFRLTQRVPDLAGELGIEDEGDDVRRLVLEQALGSCDDVDYEADVAPWLGERLGVAVGPDAVLDSGEPDLRIAVQVDDEDAARDGVTALFACGDEEFGLAFLDGYAIITPTQELADASVAAAREETLAESERFAADQDALDEQGVASGWVDVEAALAVADELGVPRSEVEAFGDETESLAFALSASATSLRLEGVTRLADKAADVPDVRTLGTLPADTVLGITTVGGGEALAESWDDVLATLQDVLDLGAVFGGIPDGPVGIDGPVPASTRAVTGTATATGVAATLASPSPAPPVPSFDPEAYAEDPEGYADDYSQQLEDYQGGLDGLLEDTAPGAEPSPGDAPGQEGDTPDDSGDGLADELLEGTSTDVDEVVAQVEEFLDVSLPDDLVTLLGEGFSLYVGEEGLADVVASDTVPDPADVSVGLRSEGDAEAATDVADRLVASLQRLAGVGLVTASSDDLVAIGTSDAVADALVEDGDLAGSDAFGSVVDDEDGQVFALFADVGAVLDVVLEAFPEAEQDPFVEGLSIVDAVGVSSRHADGDRYTRTAVTVGFTEE